MLVGPIIGHEGKPYVPYILSLFLIILVLNLMSVVLAIGNIGGLDLTFAVTYRHSFSLGLDQQFRIGHTAH